MTVFVAVLYATISLVGLVGLLVHLSEKAGV